MRNCHMTSVFLDVPVPVCTGSLPTQMPSHAYAEWKGAFAGVFLDNVPTRVPPQGSLLDGHVPICLLTRQQKSTLLSRLPTQAFADCKISGEQPTQLHKEFLRIHDIGRSKTNDAHMACAAIGHMQEWIYPAALIFPQAKKEKVLPLIETTAFPLSIWLKLNFWHFGSCIWCIFGNSSGLVKGPDVCVCRMAMEIPPLCCWSWKIKRHVGKHAWKYNTCIVWHLKRSSGIYDLYIYM